LSRELAPSCVKSFINRFYLILLNSKILFDVMGLKFRGLEPNRAYDDVYENECTCICLADIVVTYKEKEWNFVAGATDGWMKCRASPVPATHRQPSHGRTGPIANR
jgi:hypothetical protein